MFCGKCGAKISEGSSFCTSCGAPVTNVSPEQTSQQPNYNGYQQSQQPNYNGYQQPPYQPYYGYQPQPELSMKWYKFLIYVSLFLGAFLNIVSGIMMLTGAQYDGAADYVYAFFGGLKTLDILVGLLMLVSAALMIYTRFRLSGCYHNGPTMLYAVYALNVAINLIYIIGAFAVLPGEITEELDIGSDIVNLLVSVAMIFINRAYFNKRKHLFIK